MTLFLLLLIATVLSPVTNDQDQLPVNNTGDPRDGRETSLSSDENGEDVQILTERQLEKRPQSTHNRRPALERLQQPNKKRDRT
ncbi:hypothetical protein A2U01_0051212, partial [Trifolium medium]|nr:hypothetical protein [Trifolium medium]